MQSLKRLGADYVRYVPWLPYPKLAVAELKPPDAAETYWDFSLIDPMTMDFLNATTGHSVDPELQHHPPVDVQDAQAGEVSATIPISRSGITPQGTELRDPTCGNWATTMRGW